MQKQPSQTPNPAQAVINMNSGRPRIPTIAQNRPVWYSHAFSVDNGANIQGNINAIALAAIVHNIGIRARHGVEAMTIPAQRHPVRFTGAPMGSHTYQLFRKKHAADTFCVPGKTVVMKYQQQPQFDTADDEAVGTLQLGANQAYSSAPDDTHRSGHLYATHYLGRREGIDTYEVLEPHPGIAVYVVTVLVSPARGEKEDGISLVARALILNRLRDAHNAS